MLEARHALESDTTVELYLQLKSRLVAAGYEEEITWVENVQAPVCASDFFSEYAWVVLNSGMKNQIAQKIWRKVQAALLVAQPVFSVFKHPGKAAALQHVYDNRVRLYEEFKTVPMDNLLEWIHGLPWIGEITKYHLAKNFGVDCAKPDRHLVRISKTFGVTVDELCGYIAKATGDRIATVDLILWRTANLGWI